MARADMAGLFWDDTPPPKPPKKEKEKRTPPERTWDRPDYLPNLEEARAFNVPVMNDAQLFEAMLNQERLVFDIECYWNYYLAAFASLTTGKVWYAEFRRGEYLDRQRLAWVIENFLSVGFNSLGYDLPITALALAGKDTDILKSETNEIILNEVQGSQILKKHKVKRIKSNHIDIIEVAPLQASLKIYGGRLHTPRMQDLPFHPEVELSEDQITCVRWYCINDLINTASLYNALDEQIKLRERMTQEYNVDLRSKSDAQVAESVIASEITSLNNGVRPQKPLIEIGTWYRYHTPYFMRFYSPTMQYVMNVVQNALFIVGENGAVGMPKEIADLEVKIGEGVYRFGIGGLHSSEKSKAHFADDDHILVDRDVTSYYPFIILLLGLFPTHLGQNFLRVYKTIVDRRLSAKSKAKQIKALIDSTINKVEDPILKAELKEVSTAQDSLKITINGSFGKLGSKYSILYAPDLLIQVTITGQLSLLMLIERFELSGIPIVSANTDGIVIKCPKHLIPVMDSIVKQWEEETGFETEDTQYLALLSRDVNNYIAVKRKFDSKTKTYTNEPAGCKTKGIFVVPDKGKFNLQKNPQNVICARAITEFLTKGTPIEKTIHECKDITDFVNVRAVKGGAVKVYDDGRENEYLGKAVRWYYATGMTGEIVYAKSGNKVSRTEGAKPCMDLPKEFPDDIDYDWYIAETIKMFGDIGYS
jgi:hypothetical protein